jgi:hypothetical protein
MRDGRLIPDNQFRPTLAADQAPPCRLLRGFNKNFLTGNPVQQRSLIIGEVKIEQSRQKEGFEFDSLRDIFQLPGVSN